MYCTLYVNSALMSRCSAHVAFTGEGLKFTFDLSLPGKRASRKSPNPRKVKNTVQFNITHQRSFSAMSYSPFHAFSQIEVIHDYQESRSCVSYSLEGEDSPDVLKRSV